MRRLALLAALAASAVAILATGAQAQKPLAQARADARAFHRAAVEFEARAAPAAPEAEAQVYLDLARCPRAFEGAQDFQFLDALKRVSALNLHYLVIQEHTRFTKAIRARKSKSAKLRAFVGATQTINKAVSTSNWLDICALGEAWKARSWEYRWDEEWIAQNYRGPGSRVAQDQDEATTVVATYPELMRLGLKSKEALLVINVAGLSAPAWTPSGKAKPLKPTAREKADVAAFIAARTKFDQAIADIGGLSGQFLATIDAKLASCPQAVAGLDTHDLVVVKAEAYSRLLLDEPVRRYEAFAREVGARNSSQATLKRIAGAMAAIAAEHGKLASAGIDACSIATAWKDSGRNNAAYGQWYANQLAATGWSQQAALFAEDALTRSKVGFLRLGASEAEVDLFIKAGTLL